MDSEIERLRALRSQLNAASRDLAAHTSSLARSLVSERGFSVREAAALLSVSPARVDQMVREPAGRERRVA